MRVEGGQESSKRQQSAVEEERLFSAGKSRNEMSSMQLAAPLFLSLCRDKTRSKRAGGRPKGQKCQKIKKK